MNRIKAKQLLPIITAFAEGKEIQINQGDEDNPNWVDATCSLLNFNDPVESYRIKPSPTYRPFANAEECWKEMLKHQPFGWVKVKNTDRYLLITAVQNIGVYTIGKAQFESEFTNCTFADGSVFGVKVEEK